MLLICLFAPRDEPAGQQRGGGPLPAGVYYNEAGGVLSAKFQTPQPIRNLRK